MKPRRWTELGREAFVRGRVPCFYRGPTWVAWRYREDVFGNTVVGRVTARDVEDYIDLFAAVGSTVPVIDEVNDFRHLTPDDLSPSLIEALLAAAGRAWPRLAGRLRRQAYVMSTPWLAPYLLGVNPTIGAAQVAVAVYPTLEAALTWLGLDARAHRVVSELSLTQFHTSAQHASLPDVEAVRNRATTIERMLLRDPDLGVDHLAARLGRSVRSLQRDLALGGRTLREVRQHVRSLQRDGRASEQPDE